MSDALSQRDASSASANSIEATPSRIRFSDEWRAASSGERKLALLLYAALKEADPQAFMQGNPATALETAIDGRFNLVTASRRIIESMNE